MITLREINGDNFDQCIEIRVSEDQKAFVASNMYSLAEAWVKPGHARPLAIYSDETMVGFVMLDIAFDNKPNQIELWRFMVGKDYQGKGYGTGALQAVIEYAKARPQYDTLFLSYVPGNAAAEHVYVKAGFTPTGEVMGDEIVMSLPLRGE